MNRALEAHLRTGDGHWFQAFFNLDASVLIPDYVGFGKTDDPDSEANWYVIAETAYRFGRSFADTDQKKLVISTAPAAPRPICR